MPTLEQIARKFASDYPTPSAHPNGGANTWDQWCGAAMWRFCDAYGTAPTGDVRSAYIVYERSTIVSTDASKALPGDFHFWDIAGRGNGHVGCDMLGGGTRLFMGTASATSISGATALGFLSVAGYTKAKKGRAVYLGFSRRYANGDVTKFQLPAAVPAVAASTPVPSAPVSVLLPVPIRGVPTVFKIIRKGWHALVLPAENGLLYAQVLGSKDKTSGIPTVRKDDDLAWVAFKARFVNKEIMPS